MRHNAGAIEGALTQLQNDLRRSQVIAESNQLECYETATVGHPLHKSQLLPSVVLPSLWRVLERPLPGGHAFTAAWPAINHHKPSRISSIRYSRTSFNVAV